MQPGKRRFGVLALPTCCEAADHGAKALLHRLDGAAVGPVRRHAGERIQQRIA